MLQTLTKSNIFTVDALYYQPELASIHLIRSKDRIAIVDTGTQYSVPQVKAALDQLDLSFSNVDLVILTHIHLDHAGGAGALMDLCENAQLVVHPKGARHMADPAKLIAGATAVYGEDEFQKLYGKILPIDAARMIEPSDGQTIDFAGRPLLFLDTPGHASHHHCIYDEQTNSVFTGDTLGLSYKALRTRDHAYIMPTTTPVQFNPQALHASIDKVMRLRPDVLYLTHYSAVRPTSRNIAGLHEQIEDFIGLTAQAAELDGDLQANLTTSLTEYAVQRALNELDGIDETSVRQWIKLDAELNAQGLAFWWNHRRQA
jgi:glyoxylase-like metal-dependent hydrolase (beta-lactamase superfamily II)